MHPRCGAVLLAAFCLAGCLPNTKYAAKLITRGFYIMAGLGIQGVSFPAFIQLWGMRLTVVLPILAWRDMGASVACTRVCALLLYSLLFVGALVKTEWPDESYGAPSLRQGKTQKITE